MSISAALMLFALLPLPLLLGAVLGWAGRAWWWAAAAGVVLFNVAAIAAPIEDGQPRVALDDVVFLLTCSVIIVGIALWAPGRGAGLDVSPAGARGQRHFRLTRRGHTSTVPPQRQ